MYEARWVKWEARAQASSAKQRQGILDFHVKMHIFFSQLHLINRSYENNIYIYIYTYKTLAEVQNAPFIAQMNGLRKMAALKPCKYGA